VLPVVGLGHTSNAGIGERHQFGRYRFAWQKRPIQLFYQDVGFEAVSRTSEAAERGNRPSAPPGFIEGLEGIPRGCTGGWGGADLVPKA
jgi:hypothetical protein